jgi:glycogen synthase
MKSYMSIRSKGRSLEATLFGQQTAELRAKRAFLQPQHVVFCSFENRFARSGGLAAVAVNTLPFLKETNELKSVSLMTPFYPSILDNIRLERTGLCFKVAYADELVDTEILSHVYSYSTPRRGSLVEYYLKADGFFSAKNRISDPYLYVEDNSEENEQQLRNNALFFCAAVPSALKALGLVENVILHLQEWQTTLLAFTSKQAMLEGMLRSCAAVQTMHNPYDCFIPKRDLRRIVTDSSQWDRIEALSGDGWTAYQIGLSLADAPVATVSENFAQELTTDILQTEYFAPHLQEVFQEGVVGINNGPFIKFSDKFPKHAQHTIQEISDIKQEVRKALLEILDEYIPQERFGSVTYKGDTIRSLPDDVPIIVMSGRLDPMQKGYDILLQALERFRPDEIKAILTPLAVRDSDLDYFREIANHYKGSVVVFPIRMAKGFMELQTGSTFGVMPSIYEPFGAAIEYMANGTVNIARHTGGLVNQVVDGKTGFLFHEKRDSYSSTNIRSFAANSVNVQKRKDNPWATDMVDALEFTLRKATTMYRECRHDYYQMILHGFEKATEFSWEKNAEDYWQVYKTATSSCGRTI